MALRVEDIKDVALPLLEGNIIDQFQASSKGWVSGKGRSAVWRDISAQEDVFDPQYLIGLKDARSKVYKSGELAGQPKWSTTPKVTFIDVTAATNARTARAACTPFFPCGNTAAVLSSHKSVFALVAVMNSLAYDFVARARCGGLHLNWFVVEESAVPKLGQFEQLDCIGRRLHANQRIFSGAFDRHSPFQLSALTPAERMRLRCISEAIVASELGLSADDFRFITADCDHPRDTLTDEFTQNLNPKGFWRVDKQLTPELRLPVLALVAFHDLVAKGLDDFLSQNNGEGWMLPESLRLTDYGLGQDDRAKSPQPVASCLGPRFLDWQLTEDPEIARKERAAHADLISRIVPQQLSTNDSPSIAALVTEGSDADKQGGLF